MSVETNHIERVEQHFDRLSQRWRDMYVTVERANDLVMQRRKDIAIDYLCEHASAGSNVLDAGCGTGFAALDAAKKQFTVHAVDISAEMIELTQQLFSENDVESTAYQLTVGDVATLEFTDAPFGGVLALGYLQYQTDEVAALRRLHTLMAPDGILVISGPHRTRWGSFFRRAKGSLAISKYSYETARMNELLRSTGFTPLDNTRHGFSNLLPWVRGDMLLNRWLTRLAKVFPLQWLTSDMVVVARKQNDSK